jgi:hypothetical protein
VHQVKAFARAALALSIVAGCVDAEPDDAAPGVDYEFANGWAYILSTSGTSTMDLGASAGRTCFLSGIAGSFESEGFESQSGDSVAISDDGGEYTLAVRTGNGPLKVWARCVSGEGTPEVRRSNEGLSQNFDVAIAPASAGRRCFFTDIDFRRPPKSQFLGDIGFTTADAEVAIVNDGVNWKFPAVTQHLPANIAARCVDGTESEGGFGLQAATHGTSTIALPSESGTTCGLQLLGGAFTGSDVTDGAFIDKGAAGYELTASNGKHIQAGCLR